MTLLSHYPILIRRLLLTFSSLALAAGTLTSCSTGVNRNQLSNNDRPIYLEMHQPIALRVEDLVGRMTLEEKISQMLNQAPAIDRLGVPEYNWWSEALHGVARAGLATVFPQAIGLAATWDEALMFDVATAISDEARAKHHAFAARDKRFIYQGLTLWSPNINIFRDPRWGRGQETYGEDPLLAGRMGVQFVKGLQGDDDRYLKTVATVKHFAVHSGPEPERHEFNATTNAKDLYETYLPQFEMTIKEGGAYSLMCAYNRYNGEPACASEFLLQKILRDDWQFEGFVVSDCGAIEDIHAHHKVTKTPEQSAAQSVRAGTDLNCGKTYDHLLGAVKQGLVTEENIDQAVKRLFTARMKLGMFDDPAKVPYAQIPYSVVDSKAHRDLALQAARQSIVLLKNADNTLPLKKDLNTIAVIGPNADQWLMLLGNYNGVPADPITPLRGIQEKVSQNTRVLFAQGSQLAEEIPMMYPIPKSAFWHNDGLPGLQTYFFDNSELAGTPKFATVSGNIDVNWQDQAPRADLDDDNFSVRWRGELKPPAEGQYQLGVISTCNTKVYLNGELIVNTAYFFRDEYGDPRSNKSSWLNLSPDQHYTIEVTAAETYADAQVQLVWATPQPNLRQQAIDTAKQADAVVMVMGLTARMEGEEMDIRIDGFNGGDRTKLSLPKVQQALIQDIQALGKPVVLVLLNGSALALNWEQQNIPAIVEAWYPGQAAGQAIADVIFGDYNPGGRLPVTFYKSVDDLQPFDDYNIRQQTYRYFSGTPLYPFGYGLSFSHYHYSDLQLAPTAKLKTPVSLRVNLKNQSAIDGNEVVQVYVSRKESKAQQPLRQLAVFKRVNIAANSQVSLSLTIPAEAFAEYNQLGERVYQSGNYAISVGGGQPQQVIEGSSNILESIIELRD